VVRGLQNVAAPACVHGLMVSSPEVDQAGKRWRLDADDEWRRGLGRGGKPWWRMSAGDVPSGRHLECDLCNRPIGDRFVLVACVFGSWKGGGDGLLLDLRCAADFRSIVRHLGHPVRSYGWAYLGKQSDRRR
jgi:hypothetical protein